PIAIQRYQRGQDHHGQDKLCVWAPCGLTAIFNQAMEIRTDTLYHLQRAGTLQAGTIVNGIDSFVQ
ncbi:MAG: hypothetical protein AB2707_12255, partial [Candidatus Thiodiazotropha sp.]